MAGGFGWAIWLNFRGEFSGWFLGEFSVGWVLVFCFRFFFESGFVVLGFYGLGFWVKVLG